MLPRRALASALLLLSIGAAMGVIGARLLTRPNNSDSSSYNTVRLERIGVEFDIPTGFVVIQYEIHGDRAGTLDFGMEFRPGHFRDAALRMMFSETPHDGREWVTGLMPSEYIEAQYRRALEGSNQPGSYFGKPERLEIFGNNAVRYVVSEFDGGIVIMGYLRRDQIAVLPEFSAPEWPRPQEYFMRMDAGFDVRWNEADNAAQRRLIDTIVRSLRIVR